MPKSPPCKCGYLGFAENLGFTEDQVRDFADRTHALRMEQAAPKAAPVTQQAGYAEVIECGNSYAKVKLKGEAFGSARVGDIFYTAPQPVAREPLTDAQIAEMMRDTWGCASIAPRHALEFARAVERAHGITQKGCD